MRDNRHLKPARAIAAMLWLGAALGLCAQQRQEPDKLLGRPAELSAWAYAYRADLKIQEKPEAAFILRRLERLDRVYRPVSLLLAQGSGKKGLPWPRPEGDWQLLPKKTIWERGELPPAPEGVLRSALLWEGRMHLNRLELDWPKGEPAPPPQDVEVRVYPSPYGWFGWQSDLRVTALPEISDGSSTWAYRGDWDDVDMVAVFLKNSPNPPTSTPQIRAYGPESWERMDIEIEWGFEEGTQRSDYSGRLEGFFGLVGGIAPLAGDTGTAADGRSAWISRAGTGSRRGISVSLFYIRPAVELVKNLPKYPYGHPRDTRITLWTRAGNMTFLAKSLEGGPIYAPEYGFFVTRAGAGQKAKPFASKLAAANVKSVREMTRAHHEATWDEAMREIALPLLPRGTALPPYRQVADPPMQVDVPEKRWTDAWRMGVSHLETGELTYMNLALEAPRPIRAMDSVGLHETAARWLDGFLQRPGTLSDGDFNDGSGNFCIGKLFHETAVIDCPGYDTYELVHNGGTGRILYDLAEHYLLTGDAAWFKKNQWRMQAAAEWLIRQRKLYLGDLPNREALGVAGLQPPQHIADCAWGQSEWKWYVNIEAWYIQGLRRFAEAMDGIDPDAAGRYMVEAEQYRQALKKAVDRAVALAPVMKVRNGTYRSYIPPIFYIRGPSIGQVVQIAMTDDDWPLELVDSAGIPEADDIRLAGHLDVCEDVLALSPTYLFSGNRFEFLAQKRRESGRSPSEDWFWGGESPQLGYSFLANVYLRRDEIPSFLRQWVNNYAAFVMPTPEYGFLEHFMNHADPGQIEAFEKGEFRKYRNGHALSYFMEQFRSLLVWEDNRALWLAKATPRHWLEQGKTISVKNAPTTFGPVAYEIVSDADHGMITATVEMPTRRPAETVWLRLRHPRSAPIRRVKVNGQPWNDFDPAKEVIGLAGLRGTVRVDAEYGQSPMDAVAAAKTRYQGQVAVWYGSHFEDTASHDWGPIKEWNGPYHPLLGEYKTSDPEIVRQHLRWLRRAGVDVIFYDVCRVQPELTLLDLPKQKTLQLIVEELSHQDKETRKLKLVLWLEKWNANPTAEQYRFGLDYIREHLAPNDFYYRLDGKPLVMTYLNGASPEIDALDREYGSLLTIRRVSPYPNVKGWRYFGPEGDAECMTVNPGANGFMEEAFIAKYVNKQTVDGEAYRKRGKAAVEQRASGKYFEGQLLKARQVDPKIIFISGWNDWAWCLQIEPAKEYGFLYVDIAARLLGRDAETRPYRDRAPVPSGPVR